MRISRMWKAQASSIPIARNPTYRMEQNRKPFSIIELICTKSEGFNERMNQDTENEKEKYIKDI